MHAVNESESIGGNICDELQGVLKSIYTSPYIYVINVCNYLFAVK